MKEKETYLEDLLLDENFQQWVLDPTPELNDYWEQWMKDNPGKKQVVDQASVVLSNINFKTETGSLDTSQLLRSIKARIKTEDLVEELNITREHADEQVDDEIEEAVIYALPQRRSFRKNLYRLTAAAVVLMVVSLVYVNFQSAGTISLATPYGETKEVTLPDGSQVHLNANSSLSYQSDWGTKEDRTVKLTGEAYFSIEHKQNDQKFIVESHGIEVEVLGTEFNVNNRRGKTQVVLESGKVKLNIPTAGGTTQDNHSKPLVMKPGEFVEVSGRDNKITKKVTDPTYYSSWTKNELIFNGTPLSKVFEMIQDRYGYDVIVNDEEIHNKLFEAEIQSTDLDLIIRVIARSFNLTITKNENQLIVDSK